MICFVAFASFLASQLFCFSCLSHQVLFVLEGHLAVCLSSNRTQMAFFWSQCQPEVCSTALAWLHLVSCLSYPALMRFSGQYCVRDITFFTGWTNTGTLGIRLEDIKFGEG